MNPSNNKSQIYVSVHIREPLLRAGACAALQKEKGIVVFDGDDAALPPTKTNVLVIDGSAVPKLIQDIAQGAKEYAEVRILVVATTARDHAIRCAFSQGIHGIMLSTSPVKDFVSGIRRIANGDTYLCQTLALQMANVTGRNILTTREDDVLQLLALGLCNKSIARNLDIATETAKFHVKSIMVKLQAKTRTEVASIAISGGMTEHFALSLPKRPA
ncbi:response regulator transcription factor [Duganella aceris]|uniref:Response regulator transcription factor n=1 Tax=Duganella aceris TaxID=2703883 RepID=A0ABX0FUY6_9BURK|nr:response regulator transcription factor [Duganella aceris]NGZ88524.1 response regulator transcription factor [Duganella aceris]